MIVLTLLDIFLLSIVALWSGDELRQVRARHKPARTLVFYLLAIVSFAWIARNVEGHPVHWWALALHAVLAVIATVLFGNHHPREVNGHGRMGRQPPRRHC